MVLSVDVEDALSRVTGYSLVAVGVLVGVAVWQVYYLRHFLKEKRVIL